MLEYLNEQYPNGLSDITDLIRLETNRLQPKPTMLETPTQEEKPEEEDAKKRFAKKKAHPCCSIS